jgi:hypothetical protein
MGGASASRSPAARYHPGRRGQAYWLLETATSVARQSDGHHGFGQLQPRRKHLGHPRITHESEQASDHDRLQYRIAVMEMLQRCTPLPFTEALGGAIAGRPFVVPFRMRKSPPKPTERRAWLTPKIL